jgi:hypothetical protein
MTETTPEVAPTLTEVLVRHAFYRHGGVIRIATDDFTLQDMTGTDVYTVALSDVSLLEEPGSPAWADRMVRIRTTVTRRMVTADNELHERISHFERLKEAILEMADEKQWCEEYDAFAEEWGLLTRFKDYEVTVTLTVRAKNEDEALEYVKDNVNLDSYCNEIIQSGPEFDANEA